MDPTLILNDKAYERLSSEFIRIVSGDGTGQGAEQTGASGVVAHARPLSLSGVVGRFVTCNSGFEQELAALKETVAAYVRREKPARPMNILLAATPGSGKSFLVKQLAKSISKDAEFLEYHVASFRDVGDFFSILQRIQSSNLEGKLPFVLLDEVDGKVNGRYLFPNLLAPLWDGIFHVGQDQHHLGRAVLFFAASALLPSPSIQNVLGSSGKPATYSEFANAWRNKVQVALEESTVEKARDFVDRIDFLLCIPPIDFAIEDGDPAREYMKLACLLVKKHFDQVDRVEMSAVWVLMRLLAQYGSRRRAESIVFRSKDPPDGAYRFANLPPDIRIRFAQDEVVGRTGDRFFELED